MGHRAGRPRRRSIYRLVGDLTPPKENPDYARDLSYGEKLACSVDRDAPKLPASQLHLFDPSDRIRTDPFARYHAAMRASEESATRALAEGQAKAQRQQRIQGCCFLPDYALISVAEVTFAHFCAFA